MKPWPVLVFRFLFLFCLMTAVYLLQAFFSVAMTVKWSGMTVRLEFIPIILMTFVAYFAVFEFDLLSDRIVRLEASLRELRKQRNNRED